MNDTPRRSSLEQHQQRPVSPTFSSVANDAGDSNNQGLSFTRGSLRARSAALASAAASRGDNSIVVQACETHHRHHNHPIVTMKKRRRDGNSSSSRELEAFRRKMAALL